MGGKHTLLDPLGLFGLLQKAHSYGDYLVGVNLQTSSYGGVLPLLYGTTRTSGNMIDYDDFNAIGNQQSVGKGGATQTTYTYQVGAILVLCEGPITEINRVWQNGQEGGQTGETPLQFFGLQLYLGSRPQTPWGLWTTKHPQKALAYSGMAYVANDIWNLGSSGAMAEWGFEVIGPGATELDTGSLVTLGIGTGSQTIFTLLDINGNSITNNTTPPWSGYFNPTYYLNGVQQTTGFTISQNTGGAYQITFTTAPALNVVVAWNFTESVMSDAMPSFVLVDFLTNIYHGAGWTSSRISSLITGCPFSGTASARTTWMNANPSSWQTYCTSMGFAVSPLFDHQKNASDHLQDLLDATNSEAVWAAGATGCYLNVIPYGDTPVTANGVTYTPNTTPLYSLNYDNFLGAVDTRGGTSGDGDDPVQVNRKDNSDVYNTWPVEWWDRMSAYNVSTVQDPEPVDVALHGTKLASVTTQHMITRRAHAQALSRVLAQRSVYLRNQYTFKVGWQFMLLEPMDLIEITDPTLGIANQIVRIISIDFPEKKDEAEGLTITAEAWPFGVGSPVLYSTQSTSLGGSNLNIDPGPTIGVFFQLPPLYSQSGQLEILIGASFDQVATGSNGQYWGGCQVWMSYDNTTYSYVGDITGYCRCGSIQNTLPQFPPDWTQNTAYVLNQVIQTLGSTAATYICSQAGTSSSSGSGPSGTGTGIVDGTCKWNYTTTSTLDITTTLQLEQVSTMQRGISTVTPAVAADFNNAIIVGYQSIGGYLNCQGEIIGITNATLVSPGVYNVSNLYRCGYGSPSNYQNLHQEWLMLDSVPLQLTLGPQAANVVFIKLLSFNIYHQGLYSLASVSPYELFPQGVNYPQPQNVSFTVIS